MALWPCEPAMIRPAFHSFAYSEMALRGNPMMTSDSALCPVRESLRAGFHKPIRFALGILNQRRKPGKTMDVDDIHHRKGRVLRLRSRASFIEHAF